MALPLKYKVEGPVRVFTDLAGLESTLNSYGSQGWQLVDVDVNANFLVFKQTNLPPGCAVVAAIVIKWLFGGR